MPNFERPDTGLLLYVIKLHIEQQKKHFVTKNYFGWRWRWGGCWGKYSGMLKSKRVRISDRASLFVIRFGSNRKYVMPKSKRSVQISDRKYSLKSERYGSNIRILAFLCYECRNPNDWMNRTIRNSNKSVWTINCLDFSIVWILDVRISAFHCSHFLCHVAAALKNKSTTVKRRIPNVRFGIVQFI